LKLVKKTDITKPWKTMFFMVFVLFVHERHFLYIHDVFILKMLKNRHMSEKG